MKKSLDIKIKSVERLYKDYHYYRKEAGELQGTLNEMKGNPDKSAADVRQQENVLQESLGMIRDSLERLRRGHEELLGMLEEAGAQPDLTEERQRARDISTRVEDLLSQN